MAQIKAALALYDGVKVFDLSDAVANSRARLSLIVDDGGSVEELQKKIFASAQRSRADYLGTMNVVAKLGQRAGEAFSSNNDVIAFAENLNKSFVIAGATQEEMNSVSLRLTQALGSGVLRGEELSVVFEAVPNIIQNIADYMDAPIGKIRDMAADSTITADIVKNAMLSATDEINAKFDSMPMTWGQVFTSLKNQAIVAFEPILTKINQIANSEKFQKVVNGIVNGLYIMAGIASWVFDLMISISSGVIDNWSWIEPIVYGVAGAMLAYQIATKGAAIATSIATGAKMLAVPVYALLKDVTMKATAEQWKLNASMYACPVVWIIILIFALIALFYAAVTAINHFAGTSISATGVICGAFMFALAVIGNIFVALWNLVVDVMTLIQNLLAEVANFIGNIFNDPIGAIVRLFWGLADTVLGILQALARAIDAVFGSKLANGIQNWRDSLDGMVKDVVGEGRAFVEKESAEDYYLERFEYGAAWDTGYQFGQGVENTTGGLFDLNNLNISDAFSFGNALDGIYGNTGETAGNTAAIADALDYAEEDLAYLREIAEREAINRFTTAEITINQNNENHISKDVDLDGVMEVWAADFAERVEISAEGVHL